MANYGAGRNHAFHGVMMRLSDDVRATFSEDQKAALARAFRAGSGGHSVRYQVSVPAFGRRYYLAFFAGRERRSAERLKAEGQLSPRRLGLVYLAAFWLFFSVTGAGLMLALQLLRLAAGDQLLSASLALVPYAQPGG